MVAPSSLPTITSSSGSHSLCEFTGETCPAGAASGPIARVIMSIARRLLGLQQSRVLEVPREEPLQLKRLITSFSIQPHCRAKHPCLPLRDAAQYVPKLPKAEHDAEEWRAAMQALLLV